MLIVGSLCSGYGGIEMGLRLASWPVKLAWVADNDPDVAKVLAHHHPDVPNLGDLSTVDWASVAPVDIVTAGFPCTDISCAGRRAGMGTRTRSGIWTHVADAIAALRPSFVVIENVRALLSTHANRDEEEADGADGELEPGSAGVGDGAGRPVLRALGAVLGDLADLGFDAEWTCVPASAVGAPHRRERVFILAWPAADTESQRHRNLRAQIVAGMASATVGSGAKGDGVALARADFQQPLMPTPNAALGRGTGMPSAKTAQDRFDRGNRFLDDAVALLPTPAARDWRSGESNIMDRNARPLNEVVVNLLPTPTTSDVRGPGRHGGGGPDLRTEVSLLPTPRATDGTKGGPNQRGSRWGRYADAIHRWEQVLGRTAPEPTELGTKGQPRLSPRFVEWMQGLDDGYVTALVGRNAALARLGNGVIPQQCAYAMRLLMEGLRW